MFRRRIAIHLGHIRAYGLAPGQFISHQSAAAAQGIPLFVTEFPRISISDPDRSSQTTAVIRRHRRTVPMGHLVDSAAALPGVLMTSPIWTVADILRDKDEMHGFIAADAFVGGVVDMQDVRLNAYPDRFRFWRPPLDAGRRTERGIQAADAQTMEALSRRREILGAVLDELEKLNSRKGMRRARRLTSWTTGLSESPLESLTLLALKHLGITDVYQQVVFISRDGRFQDRVDFFIPHLNLIIEADGWSKYSGPDDIKREKRREERLRAHHNLIRVEWRDVIPGPSGYGMVRKAREVGIHLG